MRGTTAVFVAPDFATLIRATMAIFVARMSEGDMRGTTAVFVAPDFATLIRATMAIFVARMSEAICGERPRCLWPRISLRSSGLRWRSLSPA